MRKLYPLLLMALTATAAHADALFSSTFNNQDAFNAWTVVDANNDGSTWKYDRGGESGFRTYYTYSINNQADDWFISPAITLPADGRYLVKYKVFGSSLGEAMEVYCANSADLEVLAGGLRKEHPALMYQAYDDFFLYEGSADEDIFVAFRAVSPADGWRLYMQSFTVEEAVGPMVDLCLEEIVAPVTGFDLANEAVTLRVSNAEGMDDVEGFDVVISVDGTMALTEHVDATIAAGETKDITLAGTIDLSEGYRTYAIEATLTVDNDLAQSNNTLSAQVRHQAPANEPYFMGFENKEYTDGIKFFDLNEDGSHWFISTDEMFTQFSNTGVRCLAYNYNKSNSGDDWVILEPVYCEAGYHALKFWYSSLDWTHQEKFAVFWGNEQTPEAMTNKIVEFNPFTSAPYVESSNVFYLSEPQVVYIGFYSFSDPDQNWIVIDDISLEAVDDVPGDFEVSDLSYPVDFVPEKCYDCAIFWVRNGGVDSDQVTVTVWLDDEEWYDETLQFQPSEKRELRPSLPLTGLDDGEHVIKIQVSNPNDPYLANNVIEATFRKLGTPDLNWDFEDNAVPEAFSLRNEGPTGYNPLSIDEWGETGWATMEIENHELFGQYMLIGSTYLVNDDYPADIWAVLPQMTVTSEDACINWMALPLGTQVESYCLLVSAGADNRIDYEQKFEDQALTETMLQGCSLAEYYGQTIYVAFNLTSLAGDAIAFDNINLYGVELVAGIPGVSADATVGTEQWYSPAGIRLEQPAKGINIVRRADGTSHKVIVR